MIRWALEVFLTLSIAEAQVLSEAAPDSRCNSDLTGSSSPLLTPTMSQVRARDIKALNTYAGLVCKSSLTVAAPFANYADGEGKV